MFKSPKLSPNNLVSAQSLYHDLNLIRTTNPLIHNITNQVVMQTTANVLLAIGASPIMAHAQEELAEIVNISQALVLNIGTLDRLWIDNMHCAQQAALKRRIPIILDPVGSGATTLRTSVAKEILRTGVTVVRGNASEIMSLVDDTVGTKGVDSQHATQAALVAVTTLVNTYKCTVVVSGAVDLIATSNYQIYLNYGTPLLTKVTGMGCSATALIAAFCVVNNDYVMAAAHAMAAFGIAAQIAAKHTKAPGSFYVALLDQLYSLELQDIKRQWLRSG